MHKKIFAKALVFAGFLLLFSSCTDQGCIDADDFGEYESQTVIVPANASADNCTFDASKELTDASQGSGIKSCLISGNPSVTDETGTTKSPNGDTDTSNNDKGCNSSVFDAKFRNLCVNTCVQNCLTNSSSDSTSAEPNWTSTDKKVIGRNVGVTVRPGSQVIIRAYGSIVLGDSVQYPDVFVQANNALPHSKNSSWSDTFFDVRTNQSLSVKFSGQWYDQPDGSNDQPSSTYSSYVGGGDLGLSSSVGSMNNLRIYNGAKRTAVYLIPHPDGYDFDASATSEESGAKNVPLLPDPYAWDCTYSGTLITQSNCFTKTTGYTANGARNYPNVSDTLAGTTFRISSSEGTQNLTKYGGIIRWDGDGLEGATDNPYAGATCGNNGSCTGVDSLRMVGDFSSDVEVTNPTSYAYELQFKSLNSGCNGYNISFQYSSINTTPVAYPAQSNSSLTISSGSWSTSPHITLEAGQKLKILGNATKHSTNNSLSCGSVLAVKFLKHQDLLMQTSGFVKLTSLGGGTSCTLQGRIVNPSGSFYDNDVTVNGVTKTVKADFYEYHDFNSNGYDEDVPGQITGSPDASHVTLIDPLKDLAVPSSSGTTMNWSNSFFVRKGQVIRLSPASWNSNRVTGSSLTRKCGIGMAMIIEPRPALLCRGRSNEIIDNPNCSQLYSDSRALLGCTADDRLCNDYSNHPESYCPNLSSSSSGNNCQRTITCTDGSAPLYTRSSCSVTTPSGCAYTTCYDNATPPNSTTCTTGQSTPYFTSTSCDQCANIMKAAAETPAKLLIDNIDQCYDLENYTGKVSNISKTDGIPSSQLESPSIAKGAVKLGAFNGSYGNLSGFSITAETDSSNNNKIYLLRFPLTVTKPGRLRFFMLDGNNFNGETTNSISNSVNNAGSNPYGNNSAPGTGYTGTNGFKIKFSSNLEFSNGEWLQARLCKESSNSDTSPSVICKNGDPTAILNQPTIITITPPSSGTPAGAAPDVSGGNYRFDSYGNITRTKADIVTGDCNLISHGVQTSVGALFYCHTYKYYTPDAFKALPAGSDTDSDTTASQAGVNKAIQELRITFKILDPEIANCKTTPTQTSNDGISIKNPFYDSRTSSNVGATCSGDGSAAGTPGDTSTASCKKEFICANKYYNNSGKYYVNVKVKSPVSGTVSSMIGTVIAPVIAVLDGKQLNCRPGSLTEKPFTGSKTSNPSYDSATSSNIGAVCNATESDCKKQYICDSSGNVGQAERIYKLLITDPRYQALLTMCLVVMFTFYGVGYLMGVSELNHAEITGRIVKIGLIYLFVGPEGWYWFKTFIVAFFKNSTDYLAFMMASSFDNSPDLLSAIRENNYYDKSILFSGVDKVFSLFFSSVVQKKISALLFASIFGWAYLIIIYMGFMLYVYAVANSVLLYLTAQVFISILFVLGPIFFIFTLFNQTKEMFDNWLKQLIGFSLQQIFLLTTLAFFNMLMYEVIKMSLGYKICWDEVWTINIITRITLLSFWTIASLPPRTNAQSEVGNIGNPEGIPSLFTILFIWVIASLMEKFIGFMTDLAASISGGLSASKLGAGVSGFATTIKNAASEKMGQLWDKTGGQAVKRLDQTLFDSGELADKARELKKQQNAKDAANRKSLSEAGSKAVSDYKSSAKGAAELAGMSSEEQRAKLKSLRDEAMDKRGEELGLNKKQIQELRSQKGLNYVGSNVFGAGLQAVRQAASKGGNIRNSLDEQDPSARLSEREAKSAMKGMDSAQRQQFVSDVKSGKIKVGSKTRGSSTKKQSNSAAYDEATRELEDEGQINRMGRGAGWARPDTDKKAIRDRVKRNKAKSRNANFRTADASVVDSLEREKDYLEKVDEIEKSDDGAMTKVSRKIDAWGQKVNPANRNPDQKNTTSASTAAETKKEIDSKVVLATEELSGLETQKAEVMANIDSTDAKLADNNVAKEARAIEAKIAAKTITMADRKRLEELNKDPEYKELLNARKAASARANDIDSQISAVAKRKSALEDFSRNIGTAMGIRENASQTLKASKDKIAQSGVSEFKGRSLQGIHDQFLSKENREIKAMFRERNEAEAVVKSFSDLGSANDFEKYVEKNRTFIPKKDDNANAGPFAVVPAAPQPQAPNPAGNAGRLPANDDD